MVTMQRLWPMHNTQFGSKIKIPKNMQKNVSTNTLTCSMQKKLEKTVKTQEMRPF